MESKYSFDKKTIKSLHFINEIKIFNEIQNSKEVLIFDFRTVLSFRNAYIPHSLNIPYNSFELDFFQNYNIEKLLELTENPLTCKMVEKYKRHYIIILISNEFIRKKHIYDIIANNICEDDSLYELIIKPLVFFETLIKNKVREIGVYNKGFQSFNTAYQFMVQESFTESTLSNISSYPSEIIEQRIYIGDQSHVYFI